MENHRSKPIALLIIDDQDLVREGLAMLCARSGLLDIVGLVRATSDVLAQALKLRPDLILWDISPEAGFFDAVAAVMDCCRRSRIVLLDERTIDLHVREALRLQVAGYLTKRQSLMHLESALYDAHDGQRVYSPEVAGRLQFTADGTRLAAEQGLLTRLTVREMDVLVQISQGLTVKECARALGISASTVDNHKARLMRKLQIHKTVDLTRLALAQGLLSEDPAAIPRKRL